MFGARTAVLRLSLVTHNISTSDKLSLVRIISTARSDTREKESHAHTENHTNEKYAGSLIRCE